jgi:hypothetical protein
MDYIKKILDIVLPESFDVTAYVMHLLVAIVAIFVVAGIFRLSLGKGSIINGAIASAVAILTIYVITVLLYSFNGKLHVLFEPLPFVTVSEDYLTIFPIFQSSPHEFFREVVNLIILAYVMNLMETWLPKGDKIGSWFSFRFFALVIAVCVHHSISLLLKHVVSESVLVLVPICLLGIIGLAFVLGVLKMIIGGESFFVKNFLGAFHGFFFSNDMGKQLMRAMTTTIIMTTFVIVLNYLSFTTIAIAAVTFFTYFPIILIGLFLWYIISKYM